MAAQFRSGSARLAGTLLIPPGGGTHAGAVFVPGSGSTRRETGPTSEMLRSDTGAPGMLGRFGGAWLKQQGLGG